MAPYTGLQPAAPGNRSRSGVSAPAVPKGRGPAGPRHLTREDCLTHQDPAFPHKYAASDARAPRRRAPEQTMQLSPAVASGAVSLVVAGSSVEPTET
jgi:hypothetical protein